MKRARFLRLAGAAAFAPALASLYARAEGRERARSSGMARPNVLFVLTDDQPYHTIYQMRRTMRGLARAGLDLTGSSYVSAPACGPARVSFLTGVYPHNHRCLANDIVFERYHEFRHYRDDLLSRLANVGYRVGYFGKFLNSPPRETQDWVHPAAERWVSLVGQVHKHPYVVNVNGSLVERDGNQSAFLSERAGVFVRSRATSNRPWFCWLALTDPHDPYEPSERFASSHDGATYSSPGTEETNLSDKSAWTRMRGGTSQDALQQQYEGQLEELEDTDAAVYRMLNALEETNQARNTLIFFATDNGYMTGEHGGLSGKGIFYEEASRSPLLVRGPGVPVGSTEGRFFSHLDITATILDAAGADTSGLDGRSMLPLWNGSSTSWRKRLLVEHPRNGWLMLREGSYAYAELPGGERELYDLSTDPYELQSAHTEPGNAGFLGELSGKLAALKDASGDTLRAAEEA
jgi:N-acetylglucosamine-6-sulfatase